MAKNKSKNAQTRSNSWGISNLLELFDIFGKPLPMFNIKGKESVHTILGGVASICIFGVVVLYAVAKFAQLESRSNPTVSSYIEQGFYN